MTMDIYALCRLGIDDIEHLQSKIDLIGFDMKIISSRDVTRDAGFLPSRWLGREVGFEFSPISFLELRETYDDFDFGGVWPHVYAMYFSTLPSCVGACIAAAALVAENNGVVFDPQDGVLFEGQAATQMANDSVAQYLQYEASQKR